MRRILRLIRFATIMFGVFLCTYLLSALVSGNIGRASDTIWTIVTPNAPRLILRDAQNEYRIRPLSRSLVQEIRNYLNEDQPEIPGASAFSVPGVSVAGLQSQSPFQRLLTNIRYIPQSLLADRQPSHAISFSAPPTHVDARLIFDNESFSLQTLDEIGRFLPESDGLGYVLIDARWEAKSRWRRDRSGVFCYAILYDRPASFRISAEEIDPGELLVFYAEYLARGESVSVQSTLPLNLSFAPYGRNQFIALAPISFDIRPGDYGITLRAGGVSQRFDLRVKDKDFAVHKLTIDPQLAAQTRNEATNKEFQEKVTSILAEQYPDLLWRGRASLPVPESRILTIFGARRYINDDVNSYSHTGVDMAAPTGTEVRAVNDGVVQFAEYLAYTGNTIIIEHGLGLKSWYYHLDELLVAPGDFAGRGDIIGLSGQTGFAGEPHLHLNLSVGAVFINPLTAIHMPLFSDPAP